MALARELRQPVRIAMQGAGMLGFILLMGTLDEIPTVWGRVAVAGLAGLWLAVMVGRPDAPAREARVMPAKLASPSAASFLCGRVPSQIATLAPIGVLTILGSFAMLNYATATATGDTYNMNEFAAASNLRTYSALAVAAASMCWTSFAFEFRMRTNGRFTWLQLLWCCLIGLVVEVQLIPSNQFELLVNMDKWAYPFVPSYKALLLGISPWGGTLVSGLLVCVSITAAYATSTRPASVVRCSSEDGNPGR